MRRALRLLSTRRFAMAATVVALAVGGAGLIQPFDAQAADGARQASTSNAAIAEATALDSTFTERRTTQRSDLFVLAVMFAGVIWSLPRRGEALEARVPGRVSFARSLLVRDRSPPCFS